MNREKYKETSQAKSDRLKKALNDFLERHPTMTDRKKAIRYYMAKPKAR